MLTVKKRKILCLCYSFPDLVQRHIVKAHPGTCICIEFAPSGKYFAVGSADASVSLWDLENLACVQTYNR